ncbi:hypothetical protein TraAM80_04029 [Trypanosoma rangeli]|uniref:Uncharacterized protein n=1 Tax=Trypanosoma rangeli TaxID=5698 RepID=A0A422NLG1_TRYRA|nr:uncharacterized protein TraAM80_04029 [Trypanosoma rangeli]RNF06332.1 hypothetical protein TraAM80_04029 [Trypanosoma rangeli]|eukprot:RNF06332.1 hypothetical protein TraAM80_04029 [Trypanosoma rangeli]
MQVNLPPPPLVHITFGGQPALSTGVVNLRALLGSTEYVLVKTVQARTHADRASTTDAEKGPEDAYTEEDEDANIGDHRDDVGYSARWQLQLCEHAGLPLGCFFVEDGGSYEVVRRDDVQWGLLSDHRRAVPQAVVEVTKTANKDVDGEADAEGGRKKLRREEKRQRREERDEKAERGKKEKKSKRERRREEKRTAVLAAVTAVATAGKTNNNKGGDNSSRNDNDAQHGNDQAKSGKEVQPGDVAEKMAGDHAADHATTPVQRVHLETPPSQTLLTPEAETEENKADEQREAEQRVGATRRKTASPPLVDSHLTALETRRRRPLEALSSGSSRESDHKQQDKPPVESETEEAEEQQATRRKRKSATKLTHGGSGVTAAMLETLEGAASPSHSHALQANMDEETHLSYVVSTAAVESESAPAPATTTATFSVTNCNERSGGREPLRKGLETGTSGATEAEEEGMYTDGRVSAYMLHNGWAPQESPALGFTSVDNTLSQDFSLDSSSITSSADYVY